jgi:hypothetical protein
MKNDGRQLEQLVKSLEARLLPDGLTVTLNDRVYEDGIQLAEFDIVIGGPIGSTTVNWLIECRDRPSDGPAPASWIEQLVGRRRRFGFDKIFAVSTTGFAPGVPLYAERESIILRTVRGYRDLSADFQVCSVCFDLLDVTLIGSLKAQWRDEADEWNIANPDLAVAQSEIRITRQDEVGCWLLRDYVFKYIRENNLFASLPTEPPPTLNAHLCGPHRLQIGEAISPVCREIVVPIRLAVKEFKCQALAHYVYEEGERLIGWESRFSTETPAGPIVFRVQQIFKNDGTPHTNRFYFDSFPSEYQIFSDAIVQKGETAETVSATLEFLEYDD